MAARTARPRDAKKFYEDAIREADSASLAIAREVDGVDQELALLRVWLRQHIRAEAADFALMLRSVDTLRRLVETKLKLSADQSEALAAEGPHLLDELKRMFAEVSGDDGNRSN